MGKVAQGKGVTLPTESTLAKVYRREKFTVGPAFRLVVGLAAFHFHIS